jgi:hypothetical protein
MGIQARSCGKRVRFGEVPLSLTDFRFLGITQARK